jgi:hypothetical protein
MSNRHVEKKDRLPDIIIEGGRKDSGMMLFRAGMHKFLRDDANKFKQGCIRLSNNFNSDDVDVHLAGIDDDGRLELIGFDNKNNTEKFFKVSYHEAVPEGSKDLGVVIDKVDIVANAKGLSPAANEFYDTMKDESTKDFRPAR